MATAVANDAHNLPGSEAELTPAGIESSLGGGRPRAVAVIARRTAAPIRLALGRVAHRRGSVGLVALGLALGAATLGCVLGGGLMARDDRLSRAVGDLPPRERTVQVAHFGVAAEGERYASLDREAGKALTLMGFRDWTPVVQFKALRLGGRDVIVAALDGLPRFVRLAGGRLPRPCTASRCEVLVVGATARLSATRDLPFASVGRGRLVSEATLGGLDLNAGTASDAPRATRPPLLVLAEGVRPLAALPVLSSIYRSYVWQAALRPDSVHAWSVTAFLDALSRSRSSLQASSAAFDVTGPTDLLRDEARTGKLASERLLLVGGQTAALLLAFALFAAGTMRRDVEVSLQRLTWYGARRWQLTVLTAVEAGVVAVGSIVAGWILSALAIALTALGSESPPRALLAHSIFSSGGLAVAAILAGVAWALVLVAVRLPVGGTAGGRVTLADVAALGALGVIALGLSLGQADANTLLSSGGTGAFLLLLPSLVLLVLVVLFLRLLTPALRLVDRLARHGAASLRLAALSLTRRPGRALTTVSFLIVSIGLAFFSLVYRSTLLAGTDDQVAFAFPHDFVVREDFAPDRLVRPLEAAPLERYRRLAPGARAVPVIRQRASLSRVGGATQLTVLGLPREELRSLPGWRADFSALDRPEIARRLAPPRPLRLNGIRLPSDVSALRLPVSMLGDDVLVSASIADPNGGFTTVSLGQTRGLARRSLQAPVPPVARGGLLLGLHFGRPTVVEEHAKGGVPLLRGVLSLGTLAADRSDGRRTPLVGDYGSWVAVGATVTIGSRGNRRIAVGVSSTSDSGFRMSQPVDRSPIPAIVTPGLAAAAGDDGRLPISVPSGLLPVRVVGVATRVPTVDGDLVLVSERALSVGLNAVRPGAAVVNEVWVDAPSGREAAVASALGRGSFAALDVRARAPFERTLREDPLARGTLVLVLGGAAAALISALVALALFVGADLRDERGELFDLEAQGTGPAALRRHLRLRVLLVAVPGIVGGALAALALSALVVDVVALTAGAGTPSPPLLLRVDWWLVLSALTGYALLVAALVGLVTRWSLRGPSPDPVPA